MDLYLPIAVLGVIAAAFAFGSVGMALVLGPRRYNRAKLQAYECGIEPAVQSVSGGRFPIKFYLTAMLFIVFDIEIVFCIHGRCRSASWVCLHWWRWCCSWGGVRGVCVCVASRRAGLGLVPWV